MSLSPALAAAWTLDLPCSLVSLSHLLLQTRLPGGTLVLVYPLTVSGAVDGPWPTPGSADHAETPWDCALLGRAWPGLESPQFLAHPLLVLLPELVGVCLELPGNVLLHTGLSSANDSDLIRSYLTPENI